MLRSKVSPQRCIDIVIKVRDTGGRMDATVCGCTVYPLMVSLLCFARYFILQVASWALTSPLAQAPVLVRTVASPHTQMSTNTHRHIHTHTFMSPTHPLGSIKCMTNTNPNPSEDFVHDVLKLVVVEFIWECFLGAFAVTHPACF